MYRYFWHLLLGFYNWLFFREFQSIKRRANGMLSPRIYSKMYNLVFRLPDLDIVEIGGASGAGSIAIAKAIKDSGKKSKLIVVEKCEGGSRGGPGNYTKNVELINNNFKKFGLVNTITLFPKELHIENGKEVLDIIGTNKIGGLIHDADGHLERDFFLFWPRLVDNGLIIIDDYENAKEFHPISERYPQGGIKKLITYRLLNKLITWGLFKPSFILGTTIFGFKPANSNFANFNLDECLEIINGLRSEHKNYIGVQ